MGRTNDAILFGGSVVLYVSGPDAEAEGLREIAASGTVRVPAVLGADWELLARAYYTMELLGVEEQVHRPLFEHIHKQRKRIRSVDDVKAVFVEQGVPEQDFDRTFESFAVITKTSRARQARSLYGITGVPVLVVNGKYLTSAQMAGGNKEMLQVVDFLVEQERAASHPAAAAPAAP